jgi:hypothetical protein
MAVFGSPIKKNIKAALDKRRTYLNYEFNHNDSKILIDHYGKTPWIKVHSCVKSGKRDEYTFLGTKIGKGGFKELFTDIKADQPFRPPAGVESINVELDGNFGSIKKATIIMKCWTLEDLKNIEELFMTIQGGVVLQWGWSTDKGVSHIASPENEKEFIFNNDKLKEARSQSDGDYDAFVGKVHNFSWSGNEENGFDMSIEIMSPGDTALNIPLSDSEDEDDSTIRIFFDEEWKDTLNKGSKDSKLEIYEAADFWFKDNIYVSIGYIEDYLIQRFTTSNISTQFNSTNVTIGMHPKLRSMQPDVCVLPGNKSYNTVKGQHSSKTAPSCWRDEDDWTGNPRNILIDSNVVKDAFMNATTVKDAINTILEKINYSCLDYFDLGLEIPDGEDLIKIIDTKYTERPAKEVFESESTYKFYLLARNSIVRSYTMNTSIPDSFKTAAMMGNSKVGENTGDTIIGQLYNNMDDTYKEYLDKKAIERKPKDESAGEETAKKLSAKISNPERGWWYNLWTKNKAREEWAEIEGTKSELAAEKALKDDFKDPVNERLWKACKKLLTSGGESIEKERNNQMINNRIIPVELSVTIDGVSGLEYGNTFTVDNLPERYYRAKNYVYFQIIDIKHNVSKDDWSTEITGLMRLGK